MFPQTIFTSKRRLQIAAPVLGALLLFAGASQVSAVAQASGDDAKLRRFQRQGRGR
jgi:hypothetical protein